MSETPASPDTKNNSFAAEEYAHLFNDQSKLIDCPKELVFTVMANVLSENDKGEYIGSNEICKKNYHIPIPDNKEYHVFMDSFFKFLENCLASSAEQAYNTEDKKANE
jgi:hypothetical protein